MLNKLSVIIPVFNEKNTIEEVVKRVQSVKILLEKEIIIVDDGSTDGTRIVLKKLDGVKIIFHEKNKGKGAAIRTGIQNATGDIILVQDADLEYKPEEYPKLIQPIIEGKTDVVYGSRFMGDHMPRYYFNYLGNKLLTFLTNLLYGSNITDMETCYKVIKADILKAIPLNATKFDFEPEITAKLLKRGHTIFEVPIWYKCRSYDEGKKINWIDGLKAVWYLIKYCFVD
ncbi:glycosyltransferase family 2 protein [Candidatus Woesearchaeota archaeon]|nr:glycosyltransferase family 2 protein [Candidatus Woesearchaeota archaeon]